MTAENSFHDFVIYDHVEKCPYLPNRQARMPLRIPTGKVSKEEIDQRLAAGERRSGRYVYKTSCDVCQACEPIRVNVPDFKSNRSQRRTWNKSSQVIECRIEETSVDPLRVDLFNKHRNQRGLSHDGYDIDQDGYSSFLVDTCFDTFEMCYYVDQQLIGVAICDQGSDSMSAVYCYYDPDFSHLSVGVFSVLNQIEYCRKQQLTHLYLGFYIEQSPHMSYKKCYRPHERLINGKWIAFA